MMVKDLQTDNSEIMFGDYFLEVGEHNFIHILIENDDDHEDFKLSNGIDVIPMN